MEKYLWNFRVTPRVFKKNTLQTLEIEGLDSSYLFYDGVEYEVKLVSREGYTRENFQHIPPLSANNGVVFRVKSEKNILRIPYEFTTEGLWQVHIRCLENKHATKPRARYWPWTNNEREIIVPVYVLSEDLYGLQPYKGDLHIHTCGSDGELSPALMAAKYRKYGFDFISITDHYTMQPSLEAIEKFEDIPTSFSLFPGEEIHHPDGEYVYSFHMVNFNGKSSVNELLQRDYENIEKQIELRAEELRTEIAEGAEAELVAWHEWLYTQIKESDGIAIYPHPFWEVFETYNIREATTREICKRGLCDVIELAGNDKATNRMQAQFYYQLREERYKYPAVASSDAHAAVAAHRFNKVWTIAFAKDNEDIPVAVQNGRVVAVEAQDEEKNIYGDLRLVKFAWFLAKEYFPRHGELCNCAGQAIERYVLGDEEQAQLITLTEKEISKYTQEFFGKNKK